MKRHALIPCLLGLLALAGIVLAGCDDADQIRSRLTVTEILPADEVGNLATSPLQSDVRDAGDDGEIMTADDFIYEDEVLVTVANDPADPVLSLTPGGPFGSVTLTGYRVTFDLEDEAIESHEGALHVVVPSGENASFSIVLVTAQSKIEPPLTALVNGGELQADAHVTFFGVEQTSEDEVTATAAIRVHFANWADD